jgi:hypothetical protein
MENTVERMRAAVNVIELLDRRREESGDPFVGSAIESALLDAHLKEIERDILDDPGAMESMLVRVRPRRVNSRLPWA